MPTSPPIARAALMLSRRKDAVDLVCNAAIHGLLKEALAGIWRREIASNDDQPLICA